MPFQFATGGTPHPQRSRGLRPQLFSQTRLSRLKCRRHVPYCTLFMCQIRIQPPMGTWKSRAVIRVHFSGIWNPIRRRSFLYPPKQDPLHQKTLAQRKPRLYATMRKSRTIQYMYIPPPSPAGHVPRKAFPRGLGEGKRRNELQAPNASLGHVFSHWRCAI